MWFRKPEQVRQRADDLKESFVGTVGDILGQLIKEGVTLERDINGEPDAVVYSLAPYDRDPLFDERPALRGRYAIKACEFIGNIEGTPKSFSPYTGERLGSALLIFEVDGGQMYGQFMTGDEWRSLTHQVATTKSDLPHGI